MGCGEKMPYWTSEQLTLHPVVIHYKENDELQHKSYCFLTDHLKHSTSAVYAFQKEIIKHIKDLLPHITHVHYVSDGCAGQYKNRFNFTNMCQHNADFNLTCEWHFFATSHGKMSFVAQWSKPVRHSSIQACIEKSGWSLVRLHATARQNLT